MASIASESKQSEERGRGAGSVRRERGAYDRGDEVDADDDEAELQCNDRRGRRRRRRCRVADRLTNLARRAVGVQRRIGAVGHTDGLTDCKRKQTDGDGGVPSWESFAEQAIHDAIVDLCAAQWQLVA